MAAIALGDGRLVELGDLARGGSKNETRFGWVGQRRVVVKIEGEHGRLADEERALRFLAAHGVPVPNVIGSGTREGRRLLVISYEAGVAPVTPEGWARCGRDFAALVDIPIAGCPFPRTTTADFVADHRTRLQLVEPLLRADLVDEISGAIARIAGGDRLVVTHGDPGGGNYLESQTGVGVLLDWETASVSPFGLDLGRAAFIALMDLWSSGIPDQLASAFVHGYTGRPPQTERVSGDLLRAWIIVGGLQFIHGRHTAPLTPDRTPQVAAQVLKNYLATVV